MTQKKLKIIVTNQTETIYLKELFTSLYRDLSEHLKKKLKSSIKTTEIDQFNTVKGTFKKPHTKSENLLPSTQYLLVLQVLWLVLKVQSVLNILKLRHIET